MGLPIVVGRDFNEDDLRAESPKAVIVNEAFVRTFIGGGSPLGTGHGVSEAVGRGSQRGPLMNIVGVVKDSRFPALREAVRPIVYQTFMQASTGFGGMTLHVRMSALDEATVGQIRAAAQAVQPEVPMFQMLTLAEEVDAALVRERLVATLPSVFSVVALVLICAGLYGLMAFSVARRTAEIGVRVALGATPSDIRGLVVRQAFSVLAIGLAIGVPAAWIAGRMASRQLSPLLFGLALGDPACSRSSRWPPACSPPCAHLASTRSSRCGTSRLVNGCPIADCGCQSASSIGGDQCASQATLSVSSFG
jgi:putative ABC transport system permease protein